MGRASRPTTVKPRRAVSPRSSTSTSVVRSRARGEGHLVDVARLAQELPVEVPEDARPWVSVRRLEPPRG